MTPWICSPIILHYIRNNQLQEPISSALFYAYMSKKFYQEKQAQVAKTLAQQKKQDRLYSLFRALSILTALSAFYLAIKQTIPSWHWLGITLLSLFLWLLKKHQNLRARIKRGKTLEDILKQECKALDGNISHFENGMGFHDPRHMYAHDLDVFGPDSLFQHLNRTVTRGGGQRLASYLKGEVEVEDLIQQQEGIKELTQVPDFRHAFAVEGKLIREEEGLLAGFERWLREKYTFNILGHPLLLYFLSALAIGLLGLFVVQPGIRHAEWFGYAFALNLLISYMHFSKIKRAYEQLGKMAATLGMYAEMIALMERLLTKGKKIEALQTALKTEGKTASHSLRQLKRLLDRFDQLNNVVALIVTNGLYHNHVHALRALESWKSTHKSSLNQWLFAVHEMDALCSLANFAFNNPAYAYPIKSKTPEYEIQDAAHPLIRAEVRVANSLSFIQQPYVILTGSNMSGKSTFLKTLGLNLILAKCGAPVCARHMRFYPFTILSSMKLVDSISRAESYFQAEVLKLKRVKEILDSGIPCFVLLDEILRGTNSEDKRKGTRLFMEKLKAYQALGILATHDVDVAQLANDFPGHYTTAYFESRVEGNELHFDYQLRPGICTTPNATKLMQGYGII